MGSVKTLKITNMSFLASYVTLDGMTKQCFECLTDDEEFKNSQFVSPRSTALFCRAIKGMAKTTGSSGWIITFGLEPKNSQWLLLFAIARYGLLTEIG